MCLTCIYCCCTCSVFPSLLCVVALSVYVSYIVLYCNFLAKSCILTLLFWMQPTTVCGSDIVCSCLLDVVCCPFNYTVSLESFTVPYSHCFMLPRRSSPFGCTAAEFVCVFCLVASPTRAVEETCSVMAIFCRLHLLSHYIQCWSLRNSWLLVAVQACRDIFGAAWSPALSRSGPHSLSTTNFSSCCVSFYYLLYNLFLCAWTHVYIV